MLNRKRLRKYLDKQLKEMQDNLGEMSKETDKEKLHDLRLHAKKVKAVSGFLKDATGNKSRYSIKEIKELFDTAGEIRVAQLNLKTLKEHEITNETFEKTQRDIIEQGSNTIVSKNKKFGNDVSSLRKRIDKNLTAIKNNKIVAFYFDNIKTLSNQFRLIEEEKLHHSRKIIKKLLYDLKVLPEALVLKIGINKGYLDELQELIGQWHDIDVTLNLLKTTVNIDEGNLESLIKQKQEQLAKIVEATRDFDSNVMLAKHTS